MERDPLESPWISGLLFGGVFCVAFLVNLCGALAGWAAMACLGRAGPMAIADGSKALLLLLSFSIATGLLVSATRRAMRATTVRWRNRVTGLCVASVYTSACIVFFGEGLPFGMGSVALVSFVFAGVAWAIASALNDRERS